MISNKLDQEFYRTKLRGGEVLLSIQGSVGRVAIVPVDLVGANVSRTLAMVRLIDPSLAPWLRRAMESPHVQQAIRAAVGGTTRDSYNLRDLRQLRIPVAPERARTEILRVIDLAESAQETAIHHLSVAKRSIERFRQAVLVAACTGRLSADWREQHRPKRPTSPFVEADLPRGIRRIEEFELENLPSEWRWVQVDNLLPKGGMFDGPFGSNLKSSHYTESGALVVRLENIGHLHFVGSKRTFVSVEKYASLQKHAVFPNDIVFSSFVDETVKVCVLPEGLDKFALAKADCFTLRPVKSVVRKYLAIQMASPTSYRLLATSVHGATRPRVNTSQVRGLPVPLCSTDEQLVVVRRFDALMQTADALSSRLEQASRYLERSRQAVLAKAFRGELGPSLHPQPTAANGNQRAAH
jgi:type I restriction enzyme S subunit